MPSTASAAAPAVAEPTRALDAAFAAAMAALGPFEPQPELAVAVSGGADSLALCLLSHDWLRARGGRLRAITVDHDLRPGAAEEAAQVHAWLGACGIAHTTLRWRGAKPSTGVQAAARAARYALLTEHCSAHGILHLLLGHHADDQRETATLRAARASGVIGLAGMSALRFQGQVRLLRPLLAVRKSELEAYLRHRGQPWLEDPSNQDQRFARVRLRQSASYRLSMAGIARAAHWRLEAERRLADDLIALATVYPEGALVLDRPGLLALPKARGERALARCLACIAGSAYPPRRQRVARALMRLRTLPAGGRLVIGGCTLFVRRSTVIIARELRAIQAPGPVQAGDTLLFDGRFRVRIGQQAGTQLMLGAVAAWPERSGRSTRPAPDLPAAVGQGQPCLVCVDEHRCADHLLLHDRGGGAVLEYRFTPRTPLLLPGFCRGALPD